MHYKKIQKKGHTWLEKRPNQAIFPPVFFFHYGFVFFLPGEYIPHDVLYRASFASGFSSNVS